jgi:hypothetical protein
MEGQAVIALFLLTFVTPTRPSQSSDVALQGRKLVAGGAARASHFIAFEIMRVRADQHNCDWHSKRVARL